MAKSTDSRPDTASQPTTRDKKQVAPSSRDKQAISNKPNLNQQNQQNQNQPQNRRLDMGGLDPNKLMNKSLLYVIGGLLLAGYLLNLFSRDPAEEITLTDLVRDVRGDKIERIEVAGDELRAHYDTGEVKLARKEDGQQATDILETAGVDIERLNLEVTSLSTSEMLWEMFLNAGLPVLIILIACLYLIRQTRGAQDGIMGIGRSKARIFVKGKQDTKFKDVGGMDEAKAELEEVVDFLKNPEKYKKIGARTPKGVLLVGPAGTGKTLLARAVAGEANVQFLSIAGSEFMEMLVGVGASRVRDLFRTAKKLSPAIIFIDEIDAIGRARGRGQIGGHDEREQTLNQILVEMDGFDQNDNVIVMAATNRGDMLDPALVRPGRFDRRVMVRLPDLEERRNILNIHSQGKPIAKDFDWERVARRTVGFSGADIENMMNEAAIAVARESRTEIVMEDIEEASLKVKLGPSKKRLFDAHERRMTAYHEVGHAIVAHISPHADPMHRISIVSRGRALGFTLMLPERDKMQVTKSELIDQIAAFLGGRAAEKLIFNEETAGASNDIERATKVARAMVMEYGMSALGPMNFAPLYETQDYDKMYGEAIKPSQKVQERVDEEVLKIILAGQKRAEDILKKYHKQFVEISEKLLEVESMDGDEFEKMMGEPKAKHDSKAKKAGK